MSDKKYWIWLQLCLGQGARFLEILEEFGSVEKLYSSNIIDWKMSPSITAKRIDSFGKYDLSDAERIIEECESYGYHIITFDDDAYPEILRTISNPPAVLYVDGELIDFNSFAVISVVGTRKASTYAIKASKIISKGMAECSAVIVSGGALGVDSAAHIGAIEAGGKTVAVLGSGLQSDYLKSNRKLRDDIKNSGGVLISEYPPKTNATRYNFPMRNRLISGLADAVIVVEAGVKSGSLITAGHAAEQGRDVFAIPASIFDKNFQGTNKLIDDGAYVATSPLAVLSHYKNKYGTLDLSKIKTPYELINEIKNTANAKVEKQISFDRIMEDRAENVKRQNETLSLTENEQILYNLLTEDFSLVDDLLQKSNIPVQNALVALTMLEMKGLVENASGKRYRLK